MKRSFPLCALLAAVAGAASLSTLPAFAALPAFPGAEGAGMFASGGRGQTLYHVTNLNTSGPGSFADAISQSNRYIVFDVGGTVLYNGGGPANYVRVNSSNITIAGETAPGQGFTVAGTTIKFGGDNVIARNIRSRPGFDPSRPASYTYDGFGIEASNSIFDHLSSNFASDEGISPTGSVNHTTIQYANVSYALNGQGHAFGSLVRSDIDGATITIAHTLYANVRSRLPRVGSENTPTGMITATLDFVNNTVYDWTGNAGYSGSGSANPSGTGHQPSKNNFIGNYYIYGPSTSSGSHMFGNYDTATQLFISGNVFDTNKNHTLDGSAVSTSGFYAGSSAAPIVSSTPLPIQGTFAQSASAASQQDLNYSGAFWWNRDTVDAASVSDVRTGAGAIINNISDRFAGTSWHTASFSRPANFDTDNDGMPDAWEKAMGLNPNSASGPNGNNGDINNTGYTNIELYSQELAAFPAPAPILFNPAGGRIALINNWSITQSSPATVTTNWQPSRFDEAQINAGIATLDAVGQHARLLKIAATPNSSATLQISSGWLDLADSLQVGPAGAATVTQTGGLLHAQNAVLLGNAAKPAAYTLAGGTLATHLLSKANPASTFTFTAGILHADIVAFNLTNSGGHLSPGSDPALQTIATAALPDINGITPAAAGLLGNTHVQGSLELHSGSLDIDLASNAAFDSLTIDSTLSLGGALDITLLNNYTPTPGATFPIATASNFTGDFATITPGFTTSISGNTLYLTAVPEPASLPLLAAAALTLLRKRR